MSVKQEIDLGTEARDVVTGFQGIVVGKLQKLDGSQEYHLQKQISEDNKYPPSAWIAAEYIEYVGEGVHISPIERTLGFHAGKRSKRS